MLSLQDFVNNFYEFLRMQILQAIQMPASFGRHLEIRFAFLGCHVPPFELCCLSIQLKRKGDAVIRTNFSLPL